MIAFSSANAGLLHDIHVYAIRFYSNANDIKTIRLKDGLCFLCSLIAPKNRSVQTVVFQSTGISNLVTFPLSRLLGKKIIYYLHEPTPVTFKIKNDGFVKALVIHTVQHFDTIFANILLFSLDYLKQHSYIIYPQLREKTHVDPLLMPPIKAKLTKRFRITYLGRPDARRHFREFVEICKELNSVVLRPTILTNNESECKSILRGIALNAFPLLDFISTQPFSEELKSRILLETALLWNPKRVEIAQSGVTADGIRYSIPEILTHYDPQYTPMIENRLAIDYHAFMANPERYSHFDAGYATLLFSQHHGLVAFERYYRSLLNPNLETKE